jgi:hypothetical protein
MFVTVVDDFLEDERSCLRRKAVRRAQIHDVAVDVLQVRRPHVFRSVHSGAKDKNHECFTTWTLSCLTT